MTDTPGQPVDIVRIIRRSAQGVNHPFLCEASDGRLFWVKGRGAGKRALCCEWIGGALAQALGLPIPPIAQLYVPPELAAESLMESARDLGSGVVFGSQDIGDSQEMGIEDARRIMRQAPEMAVRILIFDWWVQNEDRSLGERGGNPNILIGMSDQRMHIIDHATAFDDAWSPAQFFQNHAFSAIKKHIDRSSLLAVRLALRQARESVGAAWERIPDSWRYLDDEATLSIELTKEGVYSILDRVETDWEMTWP